MVDQDRNLREFSRVEVVLRADIRFGGIVREGLRTRNLSMKGVFLECPPDFPSGAECDLVLRLVGADPPSEVRVRGRVARTTGQGMGVEFIHAHLDGFEHLKNLVRYNSESPERAEEEFDAHRGLLNKKPD